MTIKELAKQLQIQIDNEMANFNKLGKQSKELKQKLDKIHLNMADILKTLEPVQHLVWTQNPDKIELFEELLKL